MEIVHRTVLLDALGRVPFSCVTWRPIGCPIDGVSSGHASTPLRPLLANVQRWFDAWLAGRSVRRVVMGCAMEWVKLSCGRLVFCLDLELEEGPARWEFEMWGGSHRDPNVIGEHDFWQIVERASGLLGAEVWTEQCAALGLLPDVALDPSAEPHQVVELTDDEPYLNHPAVVSALFLEVVASALGFGALDLEQVPGALEPIGVPYDAEAFGLVWQA